MVIAKPLPAALVFLGKGTVPLLLEKNLGSRKSKHASSRVMTAPCCMSGEILCVKYSLQEASTERWALKLCPSTTTVTSHNMSRRRCSSRLRSTWEECTEDSNTPKLLLKAGNLHGNLLIFHQLGQQHTPTWKK
ncbi:hypothetical protein INR49_027572 [Caranx melampygus]|nr:hypothetical protein INR49_027572 [Caranx melampygus]